jgi:glycolate oxidase FAD binding subunit
MRENGPEGGETMTAAGAGAGVLHPGGGAAMTPRDAADVADAVAHAAARGMPLRITAGGSWLDAGRPVPPGAAPLDLSHLTGIVDYVPGDLTLTALAATPLAVIAEVTAEHGQWLCLDPFGTARGTIGATLATAAAGPLAATVGRPRDVALGVELVSGQGERLRAGGRVVKNVAGYDLVRLQVGAWGTLGVLTEVTVRLRGRPEVDRTLGIETPASPEALSTLVRQLRQLPATPLAAELVNGALAQALGLGNAPRIVVRLSGNEDAVSAQTSAIEALAVAHAVPVGVWSALAGAEPAGATVVRCSDAPSDLPALWARVLAGLPGAGTRVHATVERGVVRAILPAGHDVALDGLHRSLPDGATCVFERASAAEWQRVPPAAADRLSQRLRAAFDPARILNRGVLGGGDG